MKTIAFIVTAMCLLSACGAGSGEGLDQQGQPILPGNDNDNGSGDSSNDDDNQDDIPGLPSGETSLAQLQDEIFSPICSVCHTGSGAPRGLRLDSEENSFNFLVGVSADEVPTLLRVDPGAPDDSYIVRKIEGAADIVGSQMPLGGPPLSDQQIAMVRSWIASGAPRVTSSASQKSMALTTIDMVGIQKQSSDITFHFYFSESLDEHLSSASVPLLELVDGSERLYVQSDDFNYRYRENTLTVTYWGEYQPYSQLHITLNPLGGAEISDVNGLRVDGDNNTMEGGAFNYEYSF